MLLYHRAYQNQFTMKNMKTGLLLLCLITGAFTGFAQTKIDKLAISYGPSLPEDKEILVKIIGEANGKIIGLAMKKKDYYMQVFDAGTMKQVYSNKIELPEMAG